MVVDLNRCVGCQTCTIACKHANDTGPGEQWRRVLDVELGVYPDVQRLFLVTGCQHCAEPPCVPVCPTGATFQRDDGIVDIDYDQCIGCGYCAVACPYEARTITREQSGYYGQPTVQERAVAHPERRGVAQKCTFCSGRVESGLAAGLVPGIDALATPACSAACIADAIHFGDFNDPGSNVARLAADGAHFQMHADLGTDPQIKYLYETPSVPGRDNEDDDDRLREPGNPLAGSLQEFWDWRAALNWVFGGVSAGYAFLGWVLHLNGTIASTSMVDVHVTAAMVMAIGLVSVLFKINRRGRAWRAILRPQTSWMTRELYAAALFFAGVAGSWFAPGALWFAAAGLGAFAFLVCQARILHLARGIPAWRANAIPWLIVASGLFEGAGLHLVLPAPDTVRNSTLAQSVFVVLGIAGLILWRGYRSGARNAGIGPLARDVIDRLSLPLNIIGYGVPLALVALGAAVPMQADTLLALAGSAAIAGGALWKFAIITRAGYFQGFALPRTPHRGSGRYAAPATSRTSATQL